MQVGAKQHLHCPSVPEERQNVQQTCVPMMLKNHQTVGKTNIQRRHEIFPRTAVAKVGARRKYVGCVWIGQRHVNLPKRCTVARVVNHVMPISNRDQHIDARGQHGMGHGWPTMV